MVREAAGAVAAAAAVLLLLLLLAAADAAAGSLRCPADAADEAAGGEGSDGGADEAAGAVGCPCRWARWLHRVSATLQDKVIITK